MQTLTHSMTFDYPIETLWNLVLSFEQWAHTVPGYQSHQKVNASQYSMFILSNFGFTKKQLNIQFKIMDLTKPSKVLFKVSSDNQNMKGRGYLELSKINNEKTSGFLRLDYLITGTMSSIIKSVISNSGKEKAEAAIKETVHNLLN
jgi:carbon monoxide dehydrogenase subunit G